MSCSGAARAEKRALNGIWASLCINCSAPGARNGASAFEHVPRGSRGCGWSVRKKKEKKKKSSCFSLIKQ